jgi:subtilase family serine protease
MKRSSRKRRVNTCVVVLCLVASCTSVTAAGTERQIVSLIDEDHRVTLSGNTRPEANAQNDLGAVEDSLRLEHMQLMLRRPDALQRELDAYTESLSDKSSPNYHHWLTPDEFGSRFGVGQQDIDAVIDWLQLHGLQVNTVYPSRMTIDFSGTASQVRETFQTEIHSYEVGGVLHIANDGDPQIPEALSPAIAGIVSLHDFRPRPMNKPRAQYTFTSGSEWQAATPADLATIYNLNPLFKDGYTGKGQTIVVIEDTNMYSTADWTKFRKTFGLSGYTSGGLKQVHPAPRTGANNCSDPGVNEDGDDGEASVDTEYASAAAPGATIELASCSDTNTTFGGQIALQNLLNEKGEPPALVSISYGDCESDNGAASNYAFRNLYQQAVAEGVSVFVSAGDEGAASCDANEEVATHGISVSGWASTPYNVAVGGTDFADTYLNENSTYWNAKNTPAYGSARSYIPEIPWNDSCASSLIARYETGSSIPYGKSGFCNTNSGEASFLGVTAGSGGPSSCATGKASVTDVTSGSCKGWPKPSWQSLVGNPDDAVRDIPDVSLFAANGVWGHYFVYCFSDPNNGGASCNQSPAYWAGAGGTSFSSPIMAGIQALVNEKWGRQGNPNPVYYKIARTEFASKGNESCRSSLGRDVATSCVFYDVTMGDMDTNCTGHHDCYRPAGTNGVLSTSSKAYKPAYAASTGWDFATGIGTLNAYNLVFSKDW